MKIYVIVHKYDSYFNDGECKEYTTIKLYSDLDKAVKIYQTKLSNEYIGSFKLVEWEADTNNKKTLKESPYIECKPYDPFEE